MYGYNTELCLDVYFFAEHVFGEALDRRALFNRLAQVFFVPEDEAGALFALIDSDAVREVDCVANYNRYMRIRDYRKTLDGFANADDAQAEIVKIKGGAFRLVQKIKLETAAENPAGEVCRALFAVAEQGVIAAMLVAGVLQCEGIIVRRNVVGGLKRISRAAAWNSVEGVLCALYYDGGRRQLNIDRLHALTDGSPHPELCALAERAYGVTHCAKPRETLLLERTFAGGKVCRELYNAQYARVAHGGLLTHADKQRLLLSDNAALIAEACELPLKLCKHASDDVRLGQTALDRADELDALRRALENGDLRDVYEYRPLCLCSDSDYLLEMYARAVADGLKDANVVRIEAADLQAHDFDETKDNIFLHGCDEDSDNVYLLFVRGKVDAFVSARIGEFLSSRRRRHMRLRMPSVTVDLGAILPVCFCDRRGAQGLGGAVNLVRLSEITDAEKPRALADVLARKAEYFGMDGIALDDGASAAFTALPFDSACAALDRAVMAKRKGGGALTLCERDIGAFIAAGRTKANQYGFGGGSNGNR